MAGLTEFVAHYFPTDSPPRGKQRNIKGQKSVSNHSQQYPYIGLKTFLNLFYSEQKEAQHPSPLFSSHPFPCLNRSKTVSKSTQ